MRLVLFFVVISSSAINAQDTLFYSKTAYPVDDHFYTEIGYFALSDEVVFVDGNYNNKEITLYYLNGSKYLKGHYTKDDSKHGLFTFYYQNGQKMKAGRYKNGTETGKWTSWYRNGQLKDEITYGESEKDQSRPTITINSHYDATGSELVIDGNGKYYSYDDEGVLKAEGKVKNGKRTGRWLGYRDGRLYYKEDYKNGNLNIGESYDEQGKLYHYKEVEVSAQPKKGLEGFYKYVARKLKYPQKARRLGIEGKVYVQFIVNEQGELTEVEVIKGIGAGCDLEAARVIKSAPSWYPPTQRGQNVKQRIILPLVFKLA
ncbi:MAG: TonB family protein [Fulvivirga sp.]|nr:TonB family protein [Fulvivirga sp.]